MIERSILFARPLVQALLAGRKTQTRRPVLPQPDQFMKSRAGGWRDGARGQDLRCPFGVPGDRLWVREKWGYERQFFDRAAKPQGPIVYDADGPPREARFVPWKASLHMPRPACRLVLEVSASRAERVQDVAAVDAAAEGCPRDRLGDSVRWFAEVWDQFYRARGMGWDANPWVWVVGFSVVSGPSVQAEAVSRPQGLSDVRALRDDLVSRLRESVRKLPQT